MSENREIYYVFDKTIRDATAHIPNIKIRSAVVHSLIKAYKLLEKCNVAPITNATEAELLSFHSSSYIDHLKKAECSSDIEKMSYCDETAEFNLEYDCPLFKNIFTFAKIIAGGTLTAVRILCANKKSLGITEAGPIQEIRPKSYLKFREKDIMKNAEEVYDLPGNLTLDEDSMEIASPLPQRSRRTEPISADDSGNDSQSPQKIALNWFGGWHHAQRDSAEGFCYTNDIVIGIQELSKFYRRVLYIDLDIHHGNGVENAFAHTSRVLTFSLHKYGPGWYPGTGSLDDIGIGAGRYYAINVPLLDGITDVPYIHLFSEVASKIRKVYKPDCVVVQCGADGLTGDPLGGFNLTLQGSAACVRLVLSWGLPTLLLGGGGYNLANTARSYAFLTSIALGIEISNDIPENDFFHLFGPGFELPIAKSLRKDENSEAYLKSTLTKVLSNLDNIQS